jgi:hypothetical protein
VIRYTPIRKKGRRGLLMDRIRANVWPAVLRRAGYLCEGCGHRKPLEWAHVFGRPGSGFCLGAIADCAELTTALCRDCHNGLDRDTDAVLKNRLWVTALVRLVEATIGMSPQVSLVSFKVGVRETVRLVEESGWSFDEDACKLVKAA